MGLFEDENGDWTTLIPKRFIRVWLGKAQMPDLFQKWWEDFQIMHPDYAFLTLTDGDADLVPPSLRELYEDCDSQASRSDVLRYVALYQHGGIYVDTDIMPLRKFDDLLSEPRPFAGRRSSVSFENAVIGCPAKHPAMADLLECLPDWYEQRVGRSASVRTGPAFLSHAWFGRSDVRHLPPSAFYPYNGFGAPKLDEKMDIFARREFAKDAYCAHLSYHHWGGNPKVQK